MPIKPWPRRRRIQRQLRFSFGGPFLDGSQGPLRLVRQSGRRRPPFHDDETNARQQGLNDCKAKIAANAAEVAKNFTGTWAVSMQPVGDFTFVLTQQGPAVNGQMVNADPTKNGTIQGSLELDNTHVSFSYVGADQRGRPGTLLDGDHQGQTRRQVLHQRRAGRASGRWNAQVSRRLSNRSILTGHGDQESSRDRNAATLLMVVAACADPPVPGPS